MEQSLLKYHSQQKMRRRPVIPQSQPVPITSNPSQPATSPEPEKLFQMLTIDKNTTVKSSDYPGILIVRKPCTLSLETPETDAFLVIKAFSNLKKGQIKISPVDPKILIDAGQDHTLDISDYESVSLVFIKKDQTFYIY
jgi:hypothetical protein